MKIVKSVSLPTAPKAKRKKWEKIVKRALEKAMHELVKDPKAWKRGFNT